MNLFETLDNYKTTPDKELQKIKELLNRRRRVPFDREYCFFEALDYSFRTSLFSSYDLDVNSFIKDIVYDGYNKDDEKTKIITYRRMCEFLYNLTKNGLKSKFVETFYSDCEQLKNLVLGGLKSCGYEMIDYGKQKVTKKNRRTC